MTDLNDLMKQAQQMQSQMQKVQEETAKLVVSGESGAGLVKIHMNGRHDVKKVELSDSLMTEEKGLIEDLIAAAVNDAVKKLEEKSRDSMAGMAAGLKLPEGFKFPF